ncbi:xanthine dehydrogenase accessory protein XdhC [Enterobacteriaceae bacterium H11S18]|uniref:xanthine dehydrogenase accessory protein XdhC n=1 Tax=Dryocola clanedunensis TaxID=2925396 RepID=UPI0022EFDF94|nr:xanthine dehydrogenase accessory protein XdhC [Dryocola clanedunensis]MCT4711777.1 xanthine dehydrogenase accessory protein XdhC [Dryocola clanedunensis]
MNDEWIGILSQLRERREPCVLLTVLEDKGSVPRNGGTKMVVGPEQTWLTIGGGHLEFQCIAMAREMLDNHTSTPRVEHFNLGARLGQCCGGMTKVLFEPLIQPQPQIIVFGAGHVGRALVSLLATLPCRTTWVDERQDQFINVPDGVKAVHAEDPLDAVAAAAPDSYFVVMTHHHPRDLELAEAILKRGDYRYFGLIGSQTKRQRFEYRLAGKGVTARQLTTMRCPVGLADVKGKLPAEIAVAVAAEIIAVYQAGL